MRILVLPQQFPSDTTPTAGMFVARQALALRELGHHVSVLRIVPLAPPVGRWRVYSAVPDKYEVSGIEVRTIRPIVLPRKFGLAFVRAQVHNAIAVEARRVEAEVIHAHFILTTGAVTTGSAWPTILTAHGGDAYAWPWQRSGLLNEARAAVRRATLVTAVSDFIRQHVERLGATDVRVVYNGADPQFFAPQNRITSRLSLGISPARNVFAYGGRLDLLKGLLEIVRAAATIAMHKPLLLFAGSGPARVSIMEAALEHGIETRFFGNVDHSMMGRVFAASDAVLLPSYQEGLPTVVCEAMLSGRPVIATPVGGIPEVVINRERGLLVPVANIAALADAMREIIENHELREQLGEAAFRFANEHLTWSVNARHYVRLYGEALARSGAASRGPRT